MKMIRMASVTATIIALGATLATAQYGQYSSRSLLEKKIHYLDENGKTGTCDYWTLHLGTFPVVIDKQFPGEGIVKVKAEVNFSFLSSMYIEGKGFSSRGKIDADAQFAAAATDNTMSELDPSAIDFVYASGRKVKPADGPATDLILLAGKTNNCTIKRMTLRKFLFDKDQGDLRADSDVVITAFSLSKEGLARAVAAMKGQ
jgi:hypothetical protein